MKQSLLLTALPFALIVFAASSTQNPKTPKTEIIIIQIRILMIKNAIGISILFRATIALTANEAPDFAKGSAAKCLD
jgi:hypothetical protein